MIKLQSIATYENDKQQTVEVLFMGVNVTLSTTEQGTTGLISA